MIDDGMFAKQLGGTAKAFFESADLAITEALKGHYSNLSQKDVEAIKTVFWTARDLCISDYVEILARLVYDNPILFQTESQAEKAVEDLLSRGLLRRRLEWVTYAPGVNCTIRPSPCIYLQKELQDELMRITSELQDRSFLEYFPSGRD